MMVTTVKILTGVIVALFVNSTNTYESSQEYKKLTEMYVSNYLVVDSKVKASKILDNKCNVCHQKRNKRRVFTIENMNSWSNDIYTQVFVKKRMPKGKKIKLTPQEYQDLLTWISSTKTSNNGI